MILKFWLPLVLTAVTYAPALWAQDDDLGEATGLPETTPKSAPAPTVQPKTPPSKNAPTRWRAQSRLQYTRIQLPAPADPVEVFPYVEANISALHKINNQWSLFADSRAIYDDAADHSVLIVDQLGWRTVDENGWTIAFGKERNRRSPGLIVSPSDFIHSQENMPGMQEERGGVWLTRISYQQKKQSWDVFYLPVDRENEQGLPAKKFADRGFAGRYFQQFNNMDLQLSAGQIQSTLNLGASAQGYWAKVWKVYGEAGFKQRHHTLLSSRKNVVSSLAGLGYEGHDKWNGRIEIYRNGNGLSKDEIATIGRARTRAGSGIPNISENVGSFQMTAVNPFLRQNYLILSGNGIELKNKWNITATTLYEIDGRDLFLLTHTAYLIDDRNELALNTLHLRRSSVESDWLYPFNGSGSLEWKYSF